ncbi:DNA recombination protein RmuC [Lunatimonas lonarensis]|uniref:DNA recombination protein RmuC n=1 Tax=Lunatimonas lonarensis TaxID=1232681 RepID=R7ZUJ5_9BACT|nr:DNA recombination protein RmuC [Lunatimonas lonarensis]EON77693.1 DNA recombination protein RmuC [Lunatimonas lonarensis]
MEFLIYIFIGAAALAIGWLLGKASSNQSHIKTLEEAQQKFTTLDRQFAEYQATSKSEFSHLEKDHSELTKEKETLESERDSWKNQSDEFRVKLELSIGQLEAEKEKVKEKTDLLGKLQLKLDATQEKLNEAQKDLSSQTAINNSLKEKLDTQKQEIQDLSEKAKKDFELIANEILEAKTAKFTSLNEEKLNAILKPLGENIGDFKKKVEEVYDTESKERFSLAEKVKELADLNKVISEEAKNLTKALKGESKTQGNWGEMILESILEKSGLRKGEEYFMEETLKDEFGNPLKSDSENKRMRPDAVIKYPDNRSVIIDSKVSLNAYTRFVEATEPHHQEKHLKEHIVAIKSHIVQLSTKGYDDYDKALDFVMMFIPNEAAYIAAIKGDPDLWNFAYERRILLLNPTNLITSLKLIVDLWKREYQNQNAVAIADAGAKLYDKFVGFVETLQKVGKSIEGAQSHYNTAMTQLSEGSGNLINRANTLKKLGIKNKKELPAGLEEKTDSFDLNDLI